ncbi:Hypothetical protein SRAE_1000108600 [Strongyloides ratti]|uniref:Uncharacterized protein n=1 Tax=Strongyloides ratti TaxID=34506 RepID=A0A090MVC6_STRRB|nr:Hypothetical protein SRAE_1000108600 [Strongyloides ratti]CEF62818.1 Hypothetical protein SRAE_1000108600 [Strongyloides ratti]
MSEILSSEHANNNVTHIHETIERDEGTGFRIGTNFFIDNSQKRGRRDTPNIGIKKVNDFNYQEIKNQINEKSLNFQLTTKKTKAEIDLENKQIKNILDDVNDSTTIVNNGRNNNTYYFLPITLLIILLLLVVY